jgi:hypothetical protein
VLWDIGVNILHGLKREPAPATCPPERTYVATGIRDRLLTWALTAAVAGHPSFTRTVSEEKGETKREGQMILFHPIPSLLWQYQENILLTYLSLPSGLVNELVAG